VARRISQATLRCIAARKAKITKLSAELEGLEAQLLADLQGGATVQPGILTARIHEYVRRNVAWKEIVLREQGVEYANRVLAGTKATTYTSAIVEMAK
jgi:hypothetical protein